MHQSVRFMAAVVGTTTDMVVNNYLRTSRTCTGIVVSAGKADKCIKARVMKQKWNSKIRKVRPLSFVDEKVPNIGMEKWTLKKTENNDEILLGVVRRDRLIRVESHFSIHALLMHFTAVLFGPSRYPCI
jgi:hypothetical protein